MELLLFILISYGVSNIVVHSTLFDGVRNFFHNHSITLHELITCMMCFPFWVGAVGSLIYSPTGHIFEIDNVFLKVLLDGALASGSVWLLHTLQEYYERE